MRRAVAVVSTLGLLAILAGSVPATASGHAALLRANPAPGEELDTSPGSIRLTFSEELEPSVSEIRVTDSNGTELQRVPASALGSGDLRLRVPVEDLQRGTYTVDWRVVSADDGHATSGSYEFGVGTAPPGAAESTSAPASSGLEFAARLLLILGLVALLGASVAAVARFGGTAGTDLALAGAGFVVSVLGLALLAEAQRRSADSSFQTLFDTPTGHALLRRAAALACAGLALLVAWRARRVRRWVLLVAAIAATAAIAFHVGAGHAAAGSWSTALTISAQTAHFAAAGIWFGGLAALLLGLRGSAQETRDESLGRFAVLAAAAIAVLLAAGTLRAVDELSSVSDLVSTGYGRAVLGKIALFALIALLAARNRQSIRAGTLRLGPLFRRSTVELALAACALALAALLGTLAPPAPAGPAGAPGLSASGTDSTGAVHVELTVAASRPGPNRFEVQVSGGAIEASSVRLRFTPLDDPHVASTSLALRRAGDGRFTGAGSNLKFDGRWGVKALIRVGSDTVAVPLELDVPGPNHFVSVQHSPGEPAKYTMQIGSVGVIRIVPRPQRPGPSTVLVTCFTPFGSISTVDDLVVTLASGDGPATPQQVRRLPNGRFKASVTFDSGPAALAVVAHTADGTRLRGEFHLQIPDE
jgi:copper transport protein